MVGRVPPPATVLFSFAHPDDETFCGAGLAGWCRARGIEVVLVCATRGDAGKRGDAAISGAPADLAAARTRELETATAILGINHVVLFDYSDKHLGEAQVEDVRPKLVSTLRAWRPQVVLTFDPHGFNLHTDHIAISRFTTDAVVAAGDPRWYPQSGAPHAVSRLLWTSPLPPWSAARSENLSKEPGVDFIIDITPWRELKRRALHAHRTQHAAIDRTFFSQPDLDRLLSVEAYRQAWGPALLRRPSNDIMEGLLP
jgi:LmbE family N-acetylglucosaminyl deacetylase